MLSFEAQKGIAKWVGNVEACMREYYEHASAIHAAVVRALELPKALGAPLPQNSFSFRKALTAARFAFYSCFISYSTKDQAFADRLCSDLQGRGVRCWFAPHDIQAGKKLHEQIEDAIGVYDKLLLILSEASMNSGWVAEEIARARKRERQEDRRMLFPISVAPFDAVRDWKCFDADAAKDSAREIREYYIPDFSNWKGSQFIRKSI